jgi:ribonuclease H-related protein
MKTKYYAVKIGRTPGIYDSWPECQKQVSRFPNASFRGFPTKEEAVNYMGTATTVQPQQVTSGTLEETAINIFVDGSYHQGRYSWAFAVYEGDTLLHSVSGVGSDPEAAKLMNVAGEIAAAVTAIRWAEENNIRPITVHHDYSGIAAWADGSWKAKNRFTAEYTKFVSDRLSWIRFNKVASHSGVVGNELVDQLASEALGINK